MSIHTSETLNSEVFGEQPKATDYAFAEEVRNAVAKLGGLKEDPEISRSMQRIERMLASIEETGGQTALELAKLKMEVHQKQYETEVIALRQKQSDAIFSILSGTDEAANDAQMEMAA